MDPTSVLKDEVLRPLTVLVIPGGTAAAPFLVLGYVRYPESHAFIAAHTMLTTLALIFVVLVLGYVLENLGSVLESRVWDPIIDRWTGDQTTDWYTYLSKSWTPAEEPVGQRYLRTILTRMKFESSFGLGLIAAWLGTMWLAVRVDILPGRSLFAFTAVILGFAAYLIWESGNSARVLGNVRHVLLHGHPCRSVLEDEPPDASRSFDTALKWAQWLCGAGAAILLWWLVFRTASGEAVGGLSTLLLLLFYAVAQVHASRYRPRDGYRRRLAWRLAVGATLGAAYIGLRLWDQGSFTLGRIGCGLGVLYGALMFGYWHRLGLKPQPKPTPAEGDGTVAQTP